MTTIKEMIHRNISNGMNLKQAENYAYQEIILNKIGESSFIDKVLIKGGVAMFNRTHELRRTTEDLDFDFIRYDISDESIKRFIDLLNKHRPKYKISIKSIKSLHQDDYKGKRVQISISDESWQGKFKLDIGVHTLLGVDQPYCCFSFPTNNKLHLRVNPPEQIIAEKLFALAKHGALSTRYKDVFDVYYLINYVNIDKKLLKKCIDLLLLSSSHSISSIEDICENISGAFVDEEYIRLFEHSKDRWLDVERETMFNEIINFVFSL